MLSLQSKLEGYFCFYIMHILSTVSIRTENAEVGIRGDVPQHFGWAVDHITYKM